LRQAHQRGHAQTQRATRQQGADVAAGDVSGQRIQPRRARRAAPFARRSEGSSTMPPPMVAVACALRITKRSPGTACTGASSTSCTRPVWPGASTSPSSSTTLAV
jgi:hypothetical protein